MRDPTVVFGPSGRKTTIERGAFILEAADRVGIRITSDCGGQGQCGKCRVIISGKGALGRLTASELVHLRRFDVDIGYRLACQAVIINDIVVKVPRESRIGERKFQAEGLERAVDINPMGRKTHLTISDVIMQERKPTTEKILHALEESGLQDIRFSRWALRNLPDDLESAGKGLTATIWDGVEIISVESGDTSNRLFGVALDIGTSKIVGHLVDLFDGGTLAVASFGNPQDVYGEDVMSRISFAIKAPENTERLHRLLINGVNQVLQMLCSEADVEPQEVYEAVVVGNTLMHHLFHGLRPDSLAHAPFAPLIRKGMKTDAGKLGAFIHQVGVLYTPPLVAGFVGSDGVADLLATGMYDSKEPALLVDIGTNTEVFAGDRTGLEACSCASGPAFEGAHISHGMKAMSGAIERLRIDPETYEVTYKTIGSIEPVGICGSAMIDALAEMWRCGLVDRFGHLNLDAETQRMKVTGTRGEYVLVSPEATRTGKEITINQNDIQELLLAKAAIYAACTIMLKRKGLRSDDILSVYVAGAFGANLDPWNAITIGMLPEVPPEKISFVGNTAVTGAKMILLSKEAMRTAERTLDRISYHELSLNPDFNKEFLDAVFIPHRDQGRFPTTRRAPHSQQY